MSDYYKIKRNTTFPSSNIIFLLSGKFGELNFLIGQLTENHYGNPL